MLDIHIFNQQKKVRLKPDQITSLVKKILRYLNIKEANLSVVYVGHQKIRALNRQYLNKNYATDVLAFDHTGLTREKKKAKLKSINGDVIISTDAAIKSFKVYKTTLKQELVLYTIHGLLHLLGYDDHNPKDIKKMRDMETKVFEKVCLSVKNLEIKKK